MEGEFDVRGKVFLITGGDKGLGYETVRCVYYCTIVQELVVFASNTLKNL